MKTREEHFETVVHDPNFMRFAAAGILFVIGVMGVLGGLVLIIEPHGSKLGLTLSQLQNSPFKNYVIPGILLLTVIGIDSLALAWFTFHKLAFSAPLMIVQGLVLLAWLLVEYTVGFSYPVVQVPGVILGISLIVLGIRLNQYVPS